MLGRGYHNSLDNILKRLGLWEGCVFCLDFSDERCMPLGNSNVCYDLSPSQIIIRKSPTIVPTTTANDAIGIPPHTRATLTTVRHLFCDDDGFSTEYNPTGEQDAFKWQQIGLDNAQWSVLCIQSAPLVSAQTWMSQYGHIDLSVIETFKASTEGMQWRVVAADTMTDANLGGGAELATANEWVFFMGSYVEGAPLGICRLNSFVNTTAADPYDTPGWLGDGPINISTQISSDGTIQAEDNPVRHLMHALWVGRALTEGDIARIHAEIKAVRITDLA